MTVAGRLSVNGQIPERGVVVIRDREGDARAFLAGEPLELKRGERTRVRRASGVLYVTGSRVTVTVIGRELSFFDRRPRTGRSSPDPASTGSTRRRKRSGPENGCASPPPPPPERRRARRWAPLLIGGASALIALPAVALAQTDEPVPETDPAAGGGRRQDDRQGAPLGGDRRVPVRELGRRDHRRRRDREGRRPCPPRRTSSRPRPASGRQGVQGRAPDPLPGHGALTLDGSQYRVKVERKVHRRRRPHRDPSRDQDGARLGQRRDHPQGWRALAVLEQPEDPRLTAGPMSVDIFGRGGPRWHHREPKGEPGKARRAEGCHHEEVRQRQARLLAPES